MEEKLKTNSKMTDLNLTISVITLNINHLKTPTKKRLSDWIEKPKIYATYKKSILNIKDTNRLKIKRWKDMPTLIRS